MLIVLYQEASTGEIELDDCEPEIVAKFLRYLYYGDYFDNRELATKDANTPNVTQPATLPPTGSTSPPSTSPSKFFEPFLVNTEIFALADRYDVQPLKALAKKKFEETVLEGWNTPAFLKILKLLYTDMYDRDRPLRRIAIRTAGRRAGALQDKGDFVALCKENAEIGFDILKVALNEEQATPQPRRCPWFPSIWSHTVRYDFKKSSYYCESCCKYYK